MLEFIHKSHPSWRRDHKLVERILNKATIFSIIGFKASGITEIEYSILSYNYVIIYIFFIKFSRKVLFYSPSKIPSPENKNPHTDCSAYDFTNKIVENCNVTPLVNNLKHMLSVETNNKKKLNIFS